MWVTKLLISPVKIRILRPRTTKFGSKLAFLPGLTGSFGGLVGGCGARAVYRKTPIYFILLNMLEFFLGGHIFYKITEIFNLVLQAISVETHSQ